MTGNPAFPDGLTYVDLFCGAGVCQVDIGSNQLRRFPGSSLIAASTPKQFSRLLLVDSDVVRVNASVERIRRTGFSGAVRSWVGDANVLVNEVRAAVPARSLSVVFIDPYSLDIQFETIRRLATDRAMDLMILFSDAIDVARNVEEYYYPQKSDKLDSFLGKRSRWRERWDKLPRRTGPDIRQMFADVYVEQLRSLGYLHSKSWPLEGPHGPVFRLVYASKHELGLKYCEIANNEDFEGNRGLFGAM